MTRPHLPVLFLYLYPVLYQLDLVGTTLYVHYNARVNATSGE